MATRTENLEALLVDLYSTLQSSMLLESKAHFHHMIDRAMGCMGLDDAMLADKLPVSRSAVTRWRNGTTAPLPMMRRPVYLLLRRECQAQLNNNDIEDDSVDIPF